jgi:hypothetical protein
MSPPAGVSACPSAAALERIGIPVSFEGEAGDPALVCREAEGSWDLTRSQKNVYNTLIFMQNVQFDAPLPWTNPTLWQWFRGSVEGIRFRTDASTNFCCAPARVINLIAWVADDTTMPVHLEMMVHEARHAGGAFPHTCGGTDRTLAEKGAFGVQHYTMLWLGTHWPEATQAEKDYALNRAASLRTVFCEVCR